MTKTRPRFDIEPLRMRAGDKVFARGEVYHREGQVEVLAIDKLRVLATVAGTEDYRVELRGLGANIGGECSCPAFEDWGFCKHMVATALAVNAKRGEAERDDPLSRLREYLQAQGTDALVELVIDLAERDPALFRKLDAAAAMAGADGAALEGRMRKTLDAATRTRGFIDYRAAPRWAAGVDAALDLLADLTTAGHPDLALKFSERAIDRIEAAVEHLDDSDGHCSALMNRAGDIHLIAARAARPEPVDFASQLFAREMGSEYGAFDGASALYADVLGAAGLNEYRRLAAEVWEKLPALGARTSHGRTAPDCYRRLKAILDFSAERAGDVDARIALRIKVLCSAWDYLQLAEFCHAQQRPAEALRWAEEGLWVFEDDRPDERLVRFAVELLRQAGRQDEALSHLRRAFEKAPSLALYLQLRKFGEDVRNRAIRFLEDRLAAQPPTRWHRPADLLVEILMHEQMFDAAWTAVQAYGTTMGMKEQLARASQGTHPQDALATYAECVDQLAAGGGNPAYEEAAALVGRMADLQSDAEQAAYVIALKARFARKRNFMKLLG